MFLKLTKLKQQSEGACNLSAPSTVDSKKEPNNEYMQNKTETRTNRK